MSREQTQFKRGQASSNPFGRPRGSRNKLSEAFIADIAEDWNKYGKGVLEKVRKDHPAMYLKAIAGLMPRESALGVEVQGQDVSQRMTAELIQQRIDEILDRK